MSDSISVLGFAIDPGFFLGFSLGLIIVTGGYAITRTLLMTIRHKRLPRVGGTKVDHKHAAQVMRKFGRL